MIITHIFQPDTCLLGGQCVFGLTSGLLTATAEPAELFANLDERIALIRLCPYHKSLLDGGLREGQLFMSIRRTQQAREAARWAAKIELRLDKEHPGVAYRIEPDGSITLGIDQRGVVMPEWPTGVASRAKLVAAIDAAVDSVANADGVSTVRSA